MAFNPTDFQKLYKKFLGPLAQDVTLKINNGTDYDVYPDVSAHVSHYREEDLVSGSSIQIGDLRLIILAEDLPEAVTSMGLKDRIDVDGRNYSVIHWDAETRSVGATTIAIQVTVRG